MLKKSLSAVILISMCLHCASRLGTLSWLYERRHDIAYSLGLVTEKPISVCSSNYTFDHSLTVISADHGPALAGLVYAQEINLFCISDADSSLSQKILLTVPTPPSEDRYDLTFADSIFHPPLG